MKDIFLFIFGTRKLCGPDEMVTLSKRNLHMYSRYAGDAAAVPLRPSSGSLLSVLTFMLKVFNCNPEVQ